MGIYLWYADSGYVDSTGSGSDVYVNELWPHPFCGDGTVNWLTQQLQDVFITFFFFQGLGKVVHSVVSTEHKCNCGINELETICSLNIGISSHFGCSEDCSVEYSKGRACWSRILGVCCSFWTYSRKPFLFFSSLIDSVLSHKWVYHKEGYKNVTHRENSTGKRLLVESQCIWWSGDLGEVTEQSGGLLELQERTGWCFTCIQINHVRYCMRLWKFGGKLFITM